MENINELKVIVSECSAKTCPTIYQDSDGKIFIQGYRLSEDMKDKINIADDEDVVELSPKLLETLKSMK